VESTAASLELNITSSMLAAATDHVLLVRGRRGLHIVIAHGLKKGFGGVPKGF